jgi:hypothetical protein
VSRPLPLAVALGALACATAPKPEPKEEFKISAVPAPPASTTPTKQLKPRCPPKPMTSEEKEWAEAMPHPRARSAGEYKELADQIASLVAGTRRLVLKRPLEIEILDDALFDDALESVRGGIATEAEERRFAAELFAFSFAPVDEADLDAAEKKKEKCVEENTQPASFFIGLYDPDSRKLFVRTHAGGDAFSENERLRATMAHEIEHALQHQNLGMVDFTKYTDMDKLRAVKSIYEGDAELARMLYEASGNMRREMARQAAILRVNAKLESRMREVGFRKFVNSAPYFRETSLFPYNQGFSLMTRLYLSGGFDLINAAFRHPPVSTQQVLHPQKYLEGDLPVPVPFPGDPAGYKGVSQGKLGELGLRILLAGCAKTKEAHKVAEGWAGDAYKVSQSPGGEIVLSWNTAWETDDAATKFAAAMEEQKECWPRETSNKYHWTISNKYTVKRKGRLVAVTRGLSGAVERGAFAEMLAYKPVTPESSPPLGPAILADDPYEGVEDTLVSDEEQEGLGVLRGRHYIHERMGIEVDVPDTLAAFINTDSGYISVHTKGEEETSAWGELMLLQTDHASDEEILSAGPTSWSRTLFGNFDEWFKKVAKSEKLKVTEDRRFDLPLGEGRLRRWKVGAGKKQLQVVLVPTCEGRAAFYFLMMWHSEADHASLEKWMRNFHATKSGDMPVCAAIQ